MDSVAEVSFKRVQSKSNSGTEHHQTDHMTETAEVGWAFQNKSNSEYTKQKRRHQN